MEKNGIWRFDPSSGEGADGGKDDDADEKDFRFMSYLPHIIR